jgi:lipoprotein-anchoring transpeptidase ErfK/SrfK
VNASDGTPLYRRVLNVEDRKRYEHHVAKTEEPSEEKDEEPPLATVEEEAPPPRRHSKDKHASKKPEHDKDPFRNDAGRPQLKELKGHGVLVRKMAHGFIVALDRDFKAAGTRWWRTTFGFAAPFDRIVPQGSATKHAGNWFLGEAATADLLPFPTEDAGTSYVGAVAFIPSGTHKIEIADDGKGGQKAGWGGELQRRSSVLLTGRETTIAGVTYHQTSAGFWIRVAELRMAHPQIPEDVGENEKWIDVDLTRQELVAFEGRKPVFATLISSGRRNPQDPEHDFPTPAGVYRIREKHVTTTMDGDVASDGPYSIEDVPWVMYFQGSYALHGAFWHDAFGNMRSHGCVNLSPDDARTLFAWSDPPLPEGWHGVFSKDDNTGSRVVVHEDPPPKRR